MNNLIHHKWVDCLKQPISNKAQRESVVYNNMFSYKSEDQNISYITMLTHVK